MGPFADILDRLLDGLKTALEADDRRDQLKLCELLLVFAESFRFMEVSLAFPPFLKRLEQLFVRMME